MRSPTSSNESRSAKIVERSGPNSENYLERDTLITLVRSSKNITPQNRIKLNQIWTDGFGVIHRAVLDNDLELLTSLLAQEDLKINLLSESQSNTPAHIAANVDNAEIIAKLMERGADLSIRNRQGYTPLECAVRFGNTTVVKKILRSVHDRDSAIKAGLIDDGLIDLATAAISNNHILRLAISSEQHIDHDKDSGFDLIKEKLKEIGFSTPQKELNNLAKLAAETRALKILANLLQRDGALAVNITSNLLRGGVEEIIKHHQPFEDIALSIMEEARKTLRPNANSEKIFTNLGGKICSKLQEAYKDKTTDELIGDFTRPNYVAGCADQLWGTRSNIFSNSDVKNISNFVADKFTFEAPPSCLTTLRDVSLSAEDEQLILRTFGDERALFDALRPVREKSPAKPGASNIQTSSHSSPTKHSSSQVAPLLWR